MKSLGDLIFDEVGFGNIPERQSGQRLPAYLDIACAADVQITLFELVGEHEYLPKLVGRIGRTHVAEAPVRESDFTARETEQISLQRESQGKLRRPLAGSQVNPYETY